MVHLAKREEISRREISLEILVTRAFEVQRVERSLIARPSLRLQCRRIRCTFSPAAGDRAAVCSRRRSAGDAGCRLRAIKTSARGIPHLECTSLGCTRPPGPTTWVSALFPSPPFFLSPLHYASDTVVAPSPSSSLLLVSDITAASIFRFLLCPSLSLSPSRPRPPSPFYARRPFPHGLCHDHHLQCYPPHYALARANMNRWFRGLRVARGACASMVNTPRLRTATLLVAGPGSRVTAVAATHHRLRGAEQPLDVHYVPYLHTGDTRPPEPAR